MGGEELERAGDVAHERGEQDAEGGGVGTFPERQRSHHEEEGGAEEEVEETRNSRLRETQSGCRLAKFCTCMAFLFEVGIRAS